MAEEVYSNEAAGNRVKLYQRLSQMTESERDMFYRIVRYDELMKLLDAIKNLKGTPAEVWQNVIKRLNAIADLPGGTDDKKFSDFMKKLLPMVGAIAGTMLALKQLDKEDADASDTGYNENDTAKDTQNINTKFGEAQTAKSLILQYCNQNENGFSL